MRAKLVVRVITALIGVAALVTPGVAQADHGERHWGQGFAPWVSTPCNLFAGTYCTYTGTAERTWSNNHYPNGWRTGNAFQGCGTPYQGWIFNCVASKYTVGEACNKPTAAGCTTRWVNSDMHVAKMRVLICDACGTGAQGRYTTDQLQMVVTHEAGHAIGLWHTQVVDSVMYAYSRIPSYPVHHDRVALDYEYGHHSD